MMKKSNHYKLSLEEIVLKDPSQPLEKLEFEFENHDDLFDIIEKVKSKQLFEREGDAVEFALGLKLFTEVMLRHKNDPFFEELKPAISAFMQKLKSK